MKVLLDTCVCGAAKTEIAAAGHDVAWTGDLEEDPGDEAILALAASEGRVLVTLDKDFGELAILRGQAHCGIIRIVGFSAKKQASVCLRVLELHGAELQAGAIVTAEPGRLRIRPPDPPTSP